MASIVPILAGGGTRLPAHIGVLQALKDLDIDFSHIVGVSGGSIIASLYAAGLSIAEIKPIAITTNYNQFRGFSLVSLIRNGGLSSGDAFEQWVDGSILSEDALHRDWAMDGTPVLCFRLRGEHEYDELKTNGMLPIINYVTLLIRTFMTTISREYINDAFWHNTIIINTGLCSAVTLA